MITNIYNIKLLLCVRYCSKCFTCIHSFNSQKNSKEYVLWLSSFCWWAHWNLGWTTCPRSHRKWCAQGSNSGNLIWLSRACFLNLYAMPAPYHYHLLSFLLFLSHSMQWEVCHGEVARAQSWRALLTRLGIWTLSWEHWVLKKESDRLRLLFQEDPSWNSADHELEGGEIGGKKFSLLH